MLLQRMFTVLRLRVRSLLQRQRMEAELDEELQIHLDALVEQNIAAGMSPKEARQRALRAMDGIDQRKEECRDSRGVSLVEDLFRDVRYGLRALRRSPGFTMAGVVSLALAMGANAAIFSLIDTLLLRSLPVPAAHQLRSISLRLPERSQPFVSYPVLQGLQQHGEVFASFCGWAKRRFQMATAEGTVHVDAEIASGNYFATLGAQAAHGRTFNERDDTVSGGQDGPVAVISDRLWSRQFQRSPSALGSGLVLQGVRFTVIGIMPREFFGPEVGTQPDVWVPIGMAGRTDHPACAASPSCWWLTVMGRMRPGVSAEQASAHLAAISGGILRETTPVQWNDAMRERYRGYRLESTPGEQGWSFLRLQFRRPLLLLWGLVGVVLLVACANMAGLLLARASTRQREMAVRLSIGAGRARIIRQLLTESVLLSFAGGVAGIGLAYAMTRVVTQFLWATQRHGPGQFTKLELTPDWRMVLFTFAMAVGTGLFFGLMPALRATQAGIAASLKEGARTLHLRRPGAASSGRLLLVGQAALSVFLVAVAGLFGGSLYRLLSLDYGFDPKDVWVVAVDTERRTDRGPRLTALYGQLEDRAIAISGVKGVSLVWNVPLTFPGWSEQVQAGDRQVNASANWIGQHYFSVLGTPLLAGRPFRSSDTAASEPVVILSQLAAQQLFPAANAVDQPVKVAGRTARVVGIAQSTAYRSLRDEKPPAVYMPYTQRPGPLPPLTFLIKTAPGGAGAVNEFRNLLREVAADAPVGMVHTMADQVNGSLGLERLLASLSVFFGAVALVLTAVGLYGTLAYGVTQRTGEIGIRLALGAGRANLIWLVLREVAGAVAVGILLGVGSAFGLARFVGSFLYGIRPDDGGNLARAAAALLLTAIAAALLPAFRASRVDPAVSLRQE